MAEVAARAREELRRRSVVQVDRAVVREGELHQPQRVVGAGALAKPKRAAAEPREQLRSRGAAGSPTRWRRPPRSRRVGDPAPVGLDARNQLLALDARAARFQVGRKITDVSSDAKTGVPHS